MEEPFAFGDYSAPATSGCPAGSAALRLDAYPQGSVPDTQLSTVPPASAATEP